MKRIPVGGPRVYPIDYLRVINALWKRELSGYSSQYLPRFEKEFAKVTGTQFASAVNSGTSAIYLALAALNLPRGSKVAISAYTNMATFFPVLQLGLVPVPIDVQDFDYNIDPDDLLSVVDNDFGAIIVVHIFGKPANMEAIMDISKKYGVPVIEDCAEAHGATFHGKAVGSFGIAGCFSFYANKIIGTGEGGAITTDNKEFFDTISKLKSLSFGQHNKFLHSADGYNFRMTNIQAALGLSQISNLKKTLEIKSTIARIYDAYLFDNVNLIIPKIEINDGSVTWMYHLRVACGHKACRDKIIAEMAKRGFELRPGFIPFSDQTDVLSKFEIKTRSTPFASIAGNSAFYLPTSLDLKSRQQAKISRNLIEIVNGLHCERMT